MDHIEKFTPSQKLTHRLMTAMSSDSFDLNLGSDEIAEDIGQVLAGVISERAYESAASREDRLRIGSNGQFSQDIISALERMHLPIRARDNDELYGSLYTEFYSYVQAAKHKNAGWGRLLADEEGISVVDIPPLVRISSDRPKATVTRGYRRTKA